MNTAACGFAVLLVPTLRRGNALPRRSGVEEALLNVDFSSCTKDAGASPNCVPTPDRGNEVIGLNNRGEIPAKRDFHATPRFS
jgi:hypothetical protein